MNRRTALAVIAAAPVVGLVPQKAAGVDEEKLVHQWIDTSLQYYCNTKRQNYIYMSHKGDSTEWVVKGDSEERKAILKALKEADAHKYDDWQETYDDYMWSVPEK